ncbi:MAG: hypothetical protein COV75_03090 [Candidatus Omnitrophica bacterium CG11_big_fil_rev_8_21_14_0_20_63_9]|nr:MAG: hypothetical protein COV75_03090 [Candidatus Omnitrophica bacterium CG11_big_fil_rev_8_21_14_0_20_63_9]
MSAVPVSAADVPLPPGQKKPAPVVSMTIGAQPMEGQFYAVKGTEAFVKKFYQEALPDRGWDVRPLPWMAQAGAKAEELAKTLKEQSNAAKLDVETKAQMEQFSPAALQAAASETVYAVQDADRVMIRLLARGPAQTVVLVYRWHHESGAEESPLARDPSSKDPGLSNPCCTQDTVPAERRTLPLTIPRYPNARMISASRAPNSTPQMEMVSELYLSADPVSDVLRYYREQMPLVGWTEAGNKQRIQQPRFLESIGPVAKQLNFSTINFKNDVGDLCGVFVGENLSPVPGGGPPEGTMIAVHYLRTPTLRARASGRSLPPSMKPAGVEKVKP